MEKLPNKYSEEDKQMQNLLRQKYNKQNEVRKKMEEIQDDLTDIRNNIGEENYRVMVDIKYGAEFDTLLKKEEKLAKEIENLENELGIKGEDELENEEDTGTFEPDR